MFHEDLTQRGSFRAERLVTANGAAYVEVGTGEPLVLVHGVGMRLEAWAPQLTALSAKNRVIAVDMPGHGESGKLETGARLEDFVAWLGVFLDDLRLDGVSLAGHSMGALISGGAAATFADRIRRVALLNGVYLRDPAAKAAVIARARTISSGTVDVDGPLRRWFGEGSERSSAYRSTRSWLQAVDPDAYATAYNAFAHGDDVYAECWSKVNCPALFLTGSQDPNSTPEMAHAMADAAPRGWAHIVEGHRHMVNLTAPELVNELLADWLSRGGETS
ncbi:alpha/beta fold hydrolase [Sinorhizobium numidicum]|uniref:Alpha/beta fold hydrolase n=1 Tax=Sinorhizobium numidicum TaxID=680248 RepID=A0ABY8CPB3_9HYPH|nr:alpha/beta fold hydrolase [Sinorhizobium numidicum]WEX74491.1 alpha/beta fold hydrolase [Sinorhizobium numidicum]WEX80481.1 alpha/beta fold hydrolase [Sinorhizobium numidicum]